MSTILKIGLLLTIAAAPVALQERARLCAEPARLDGGMSKTSSGERESIWAYDERCLFERKRTSPGGAVVTERGRVTTPVLTAKGWALGECVTFRRTQTERGSTEVYFQCTGDHRKSREVETRADGVIVTRIFDEQTGRLDRAYTDRPTIGSEHAFRRERFDPDGGVTEVVDYVARDRASCGPLGWPPDPTASDMPGPWKQ